MKRILLLLLIAVSCTSRSAWTEWEKTVIEQSDSVMYVCVMPADSTILRAQSREDFTVLWADDASRILRRTVWALPPRRLELTVAWCW